MSIFFRGKMSHFGGPTDEGVKADEGLALVTANNMNQVSEYFLPSQPAGTTGLARRLNPDKYYIACRWSYAQTPKSFLLGRMVRVTNPTNGKSAEAKPVDWGPHGDTQRVADLSPGLANYLGLATNGLVEVTLLNPSDIRLIFRQGGQLLKCFSARGDLLWSCPARGSISAATRQVEGNVGLYKCGQPLRIDRSFPQAPDLGSWYVELFQPSAAGGTYAPSVAGIHGGGLGLADPFAPKQGWVTVPPCICAPLGLGISMAGLSAPGGWIYTGGGVRLQNQDMELFAGTVSRVQQQSATAWLTAD